MNQSPLKPREGQSTSAEAVVQMGIEGRERSGASEQSDRVRFDAPAQFPQRVLIAKRIIDVLGSVLALTVGAPLIAAIALFVKFTSKGPIFYHQERVRRVVGGVEETYAMHKFRSMVVDAEALSGPVWAGERDPRITPVGAFLRKSRLDEVPQFWNVLKGEMSIVGPRPERPHFTSKLQDQIPVYYDRARQLKPGITGWAQVRCPYDASIDSVKTKLLYDIAYAAHCYKLSTYLKMELKIMVLTVAVMFTGKGAQ